MKKGNQPLRMCAGCRQMKPKSELLRICLDESKEAMIDGSGKSGGRGVYVCRDEACIARALKNNGISRGLKTGLDRERLEKVLHIPAAAKPRPNA